MASVSGVGTTGVSSSDDTNEVDSTTQTPSAAPPPTPSDSNAVESYPGKFGEQLNDIDDRIDGRWFGKSSDEVNKDLDALPPDTFHATVDQLAQNGRLDSFLSHCDDQTRREFLEVAVRKGYLQADPAIALQGPCDPPVRPALIRTDKSLPPEIQSAISDDCARIKKNYARDYREYEERYADTARNAQSIPELRKLGPPAPPVEVYEPGYVGHDEKFHGIAGATPSDKPFQAVEDRICELTGDRRAGSLYLHIKAEAAIGNVRLGADIKKVQHDRLRVGSELGLGRDESAVMFDGKTGKLDNVQLGSEGTFIRQDREGTTTIGLPVAGPLGVQTEVNGKEAMMGVGGNAHLEVAENVEIAAEITGGAYGLSEEQAKQAVESPGFFYAPERAQGVRFDELPAERRAAYEKMHWTQSEWNSGIR